MHDMMESGTYWHGYHAGMNKHPWNIVPFEPGTRKFHLWLEGHSDGMKAHALVKLGHGHSH
jgi:ribosome modulation factor